MITASEAFHSRTHILATATGLPPSENVLGKTSGKSTSFETFHINFCEELRIFGGKLEIVWQSFEYSVKSFEYSVKNFEYSVRNFESSVKTLNFLN